MTWTKKTGNSTTWTVGSVLTSWAKKVSNSTTWGNIADKVSSWGNISDQSSTWVGEELLVNNTFDSDDNWFLSYSEGTVTLDGKLTINMDLASTHATVTQYPSVLNTWVHTHKTYVIEAVVESFEDNEPGNECGWNIQCGKDGIFESAGAGTHTLEYTPDYEQLGLVIKVCFGSILVIKSISLKEVH